MVLYILLGFIALISIEIMLFVEVGDLVGPAATVLLTFGTAALGIFMVRAQGLGLLLSLRARLDRGDHPQAEILAGTLLVIAALLLLIPGFFTDAVGFILLIPPVRQKLANSGRPMAQTRAHPGVIDADFREVDPDTDDPRPIDDNR